MRLKRRSRTCTQYIIRWLVYDLPGIRLERSSAHCKFYSMRCFICGDLRLVVDRLMQSAVDRLMRSAAAQYSRNSVELRSLKEAKYVGVVPERALLFPLAAVLQFAVRLWWETISSWWAILYTILVSFMRFTGLWCCKRLRWCSLRNLEIDPS